MTAIHGFENMGKDVFVLKQRDRAGAKRGVDGEYSH